MLGFTFVVLLLLNFCFFVFNNEVLVVLLFAVVMIVGVVFVFIVERVLV